MLFLNLTLLTFAGNRQRLAHYSIG
uniref:Macaca fascicularis brain cDNA, clone: QmoA-11967 n=1 Tax=Macaca fascicularis TaxID=9541 RepID=I7G8M7_MACFA|nr:unnamed protein product [Macaca fascicularis]